MPTVAMLAGVILISAVAVWHAAQPSGTVAAIDPGIAQRLAAQTGRTSGRTPLDGSAGMSTAPRGIAGPGGAAASTARSSPAPQAGTGPAAPTTTKDSDRDTSSNPPPEPRIAPQPAETGETSDLPVRLSLPALSLDAPIDPVGVTKNGELEIPADVHTLGWYKFGPEPGSPTGSVVIVGHVDSAEQGTGSFFYLRTVASGDVITIVGSRGSMWRYRVVGVEQYPKTSVPLDAIFSPAGSPRLTLITCGGPFDRTARSYLDNIVVTAVPDGD